MRRPNEGVLCVIAHAARIGERQRAAHSGRPGIAIEHGGKLLTGDIAVGVRSIGHAVFPCPRDALIIPVLPGSRGGVHAGKPRQHGIHHAARHGTLHAKLVVAHTLEQFTGGNEVHLISQPVLTGVDEVLGIVHDLHRCTAVHGGPDAVGIGCGLGSAAVLGGSGLHLGAVLLGLGLDLGAVGLGGGLHLSGAAGIVTVRGRTAAGVAGAARGRTAIRGRSAGGLGLNGQRVNGAQSFLWRKGNSAEAGVVDRPPRCPLPVVE